ncbi:MAG: nucleotidyltransferase domain-containing protein [Acidobacteriota bacterium]|nr:MAG: nucleotidyltransferase domain-containing protein [Acidobacteriota bacterium]
MLKPEMATYVVDSNNASSQWYDSREDSQQREEYIRRLCDRIADRFHPDKIILFGSQAWGEPSTESDIDILVVMTYEGRHTSQAIRIVNELNTLAPIDLIVRSAEEIRARREIGDTFIRNIIDRGKVMYEADHQ